MPTAVKKEPARMKTAVSKAAKPTGKKELREMRITPSENGGHVIEHQYHNDDGAYHESETHSFGPKDGAKVKKHIMTNLNLATPAAVPGGAASENEMGDEE